MTSVRFPTTKDAFVEALNAEGIVHTVSEPIKKRIPPIELPELSE